MLSLSVFAFDYTFSVDVTDSSGMHFPQSLQGSASRGNKAERTKDRREEGGDEGETRAPRLLQS